MCVRKTIKAVQSATLSIFKVKAGIVAGGNGCVGHRRKNVCFLCSQLLFAQWLRDAFHWTSSPFSIPGVSRCCAHYLAKQAASSCLLLQYLLVWVCWFCSQLYRVRLEKLLLVEQFACVHWMLGDCFSLCIFLWVSQRNEAHLCTGNRRYGGNLNMSKYWFYLTLDCLSCATEQNLFANSVLYNKAGVLRLDNKPPGDFFFLAFFESCIFKWDDITAILWFGNESLK